MLIRADDPCCRLMDSSSKFIIIKKSSLPLVSAVLLTNYGNYGNNSGFDISGIEYNKWTLGYGFRCCLLISPDCVVNACQHMLVISFIISKPDVHVDCHADNSCACCISFGARTLFRLPFDVFCMCLTSAVHSTTHPIHSRFDG
jgi:hypothetical protein